MKLMALFRSHDPPDGGYLGIGQVLFLILIAHLDGERKKTITPRGGIMVVLQSEI